MGAYSVVYNSNETGHDAHAQFAVDWDWEVRGQWARSVREGLGTAWESSKGLDKEAYPALLDHFGLTDWESEYPAGRIITMCPEELLRERRVKEKLYDLPRKEMCSDTIGDHRAPAEPLLERQLTLFLLEEKSERGKHPERHFRAIGTHTTNEWEMVESVSLSPGEVLRLAALDDENLNPELYAKFGVTETELNPPPGQLRGLSYADCRFVVRGKLSEWLAHEQHLTLYLLEREGQDGEGSFERWIDLTVSLQVDDEWTERRHISVSPGDVERLITLNDENFTKALYAEFGISDLSDAPGYPKGPYYRLDFDDLHKALAVWLESRTAKSP